MSSSTIYKLKKCHSANIPLILIGMFWPPIYVHDKASISYIRFYAVDFFKVFLKFCGVKIMLVAFGTRPPFCFRHNALPFGFIIYD